MDLNYYKMNNQRLFGHFLAYNNKISLEKKENNRKDSFGGRLSSRFGQFSPLKK